LDKQQRKFEILAGEKAALEAELESLSQALFEEANKMVATERIKLAEADDELQSTIQEKEALKSALKLIEKENDRLRQSRFEKSDVSSEDNTQRTLLSLSSEQEEKTREARMILERSHSPKQSNDPQEERQAPAEGPAERETVEDSGSNDTVTGLTESLTVSHLSSSDPNPKRSDSESASLSSPSQTQSESQTQSQSDIDKPWTSFFRQNSSSGIISMG